MLTPALWLRLCPRVSLRCRLLPRPQRFPDATVSVRVLEAPAPRPFACFFSLPGWNGEAAGDWSGRKQVPQVALTEDTASSTVFPGPSLWGRLGVFTPSRFCTHCGPFSDLLRTRPGFWRKRAGRCQGPPKTVAPRNPSLSCGSPRSFYQFIKVSTKRFPQLVAPAAPAPGRQFSAFFLRVWLSLQTSRRQFAL